MVVGVGMNIFRLHECRSLKSKSKIVKSVIGKMRSHFKMFAAENGAKDIY